MKYMQMKTGTLFLLLLMGVGSLFAQEAVLTNGGDASGPGGSASYSIGQVFYATYTDTNGSMAEGVQQPFEISIGTGIEVAGIQLEMSAFPNPATSNLTLLIDQLSNEALSYQLTDLHGRTLARQQVNSDRTVINMEHLTASIYLLHVIDQQQTVKTFKILKR